MTTDRIINAAIQAAAKLSVALNDHRLIPNPEGVTTAANELRSDTAGTELMLMCNALADAAEHASADATLDTHAAGAEFDRIRHRLDIRCRVEAGKNLDRKLDQPGLADLPAAELDRLAAVANWIDARDDDAPPPPAA